jgi:hypothetical protein
MKAHKHEVSMKDDTRLALLEQSIGHINESLARIEKRFDNVEVKIEDVRKNSWSQFRWIMGFIFAVSSAVMGMVIKGHF